MGDELDIEMIRARCEAATPGPYELIRCDNDGGEILWQVQIGSGEKSVVFCASDLEGPRVREAARLFARAREDILALLSALESARKERDEARVQVALTHDQLTNGLRLNDDGTYTLLWTQEQIDRTADTAAKWCAMWGLDGRYETELAQAKRERDAARRERMPHMCRMDHDEIRHADSEHEACPVCRMREERDEARRERDEALAHLDFAARDLANAGFRHDTNERSYPPKHSEISECISSLQRERDEARAALGEIGAMLPGLRESGREGAAIADRLAAVLRRADERDGGGK